MKRMLVIVAHPDDESFGPSGTLALYARLGVEIHLVCVTNGEASDIVLPGTEALNAGERRLVLTRIRQQEVRLAADVIGIAQIDFLNYPDGQLCNAIYHDIAHDIMTKIEYYSPHVIIAPEPQGITGHLDHIAVSMITTYAFINTKQGQKLYYVCLPKEIVNMTPYEHYFVYFPPGYDQSSITTRIDYSSFADIKIKAIRQHASQINDGNKLIDILKTIPKIDHFILHKYRNCEISLPEDDLFLGIVS